MADKENCVRVTRLAAKKRVPSSQSTEKPRIILGEVQNTPQKSVIANDFPKKRKITNPKKSNNMSEEMKIAESKVEDTPCEAYASSTYEYLLTMEKEKNRRPLPNYLEKVQKDITANMRGILVDWLVDVAEEYKLTSDTLYRTISNVDRFLSKNPINRQKLQLLGVSSMLLASKYDEITPPRVEDFCYVTDNTYTKQEILEMQSRLLDSLSFELGSPTVKTFLRGITSIAGKDCQSSALLEPLSCYIAELSLLDYDFVKFLPSLIASSVVFLAKYTLQPNKHPWNASLQRCLGFEARDLRECVCILQELRMGRRGSSLIAVREKYKQPRFQYVSNLPLPSTIPECYFECTKD